MADKQVVAIAGASDTAKYLVEELEKTNRYSIVLITRAVRPLSSSLTYARFAES